MPSRNLHLPHSSPVRFTKRPPGHFRIQPINPQNQFQNPQLQKQPTGSRNQARLPPPQPQTRNLDSSLRISREVISPQPTSSQHPLFIPEHQVASSSRGRYDDQEGFNFTSTLGKRRSEEDEMVDQLAGEGEELPRLFRIPKRRVLSNDQAGVDDE
jgi:hypothetical protein